MAESPAMTLSRGTILAFLQVHWATLQTMGVAQIGLFTFSWGVWSNSATPAAILTCCFRMDNMTFTRWMDVWNFLEDGLGVEVDLVPEQDFVKKFAHRY